MVEYRYRCVIIVANSDPRKYLLPCRFRQNFAINNAQEKQMRMNGGGT